MKDINQQLAEEALSNLMKQNNFRSIKFIDSPAESSMLDLWVESGSPHECMLVEKYENLYVYLDYGHGWVFAVKHEIDEGKNKFVCDFTAGHPMLLGDALIYPEHAGKGCIYLKATATSQSK